MSDDEPCQHMLDAPHIDPPEPPRECHGCVAEGRRDWVHLRSCQYCGTVGCCDSSPGKHATAHYVTTGHPVVRSCEPGETWWWCYIDHRVVDDVRLQAPPTDGST